VSLVFPSGCKESSLIVDTEKILQSGGMEGRGMAIYCTLKLSSLLGSTRHQTTAHVDGGSLLPIKKLEELQV